MHAIIESESTRTRIEDASLEGRSDKEMCVALLHDADFSILAADVPTYMWYCSGICREYVGTCCTMEEYRDGRFSFLEGILYLPFIFVIERYEREFGDVARFNVLSEMRWLDPKRYKSNLQSELVKLGALAEKHGLASSAALLNKDF